MHTRIVTGLVLSVVIGLGVTGCGSDEGAGSGEASSVEGVTWVLDELEGDPVPDGVEVTMTYDGERVEGNGGCNQYGGTATFADGTVNVVDELMVTLMACEGSAEEVESRYLATLTSVTAFAVDGDRLVMSTESDDDLLVFSRRT